MASVIAALVGAVVGGLVVHRLTLAREMVSARRAHRVDFLLSAYRRLIRASNRDRMTPEYRDDLEAAFSDVMLLGGPEEIAAAHACMVEFVKHRSVSLDAVIFALRRSLREEVGIGDVPMPTPYNLRFTLDDDERERLVRKQHGEAIPLR